MLVYGTVRHGALGCRVRWCGVVVGVDLLVCVGGGSHPFAAGGDACQVAGVLGWAYEVLALDATQLNRHAARPLSPKMAFVIRVFRVFLLVLVFICSYSRLRLIQLKR